MKRLLLLFCLIWFGSAHAQLLLVGGKRIELKREMVLHAMDFQSGTIRFLQADSLDKITGMKIILVIPAEQKIQTFEFPSSEFPMMLTARLRKPIKGKLLIEEYTTAGKGKRRIKFNITLEP